MGRREELLSAATDHVLTTGLIGMSLRPLAEALGTSDRMLLYHFKTKDHLVAAILRESNDRSLAYLAATPSAGDVRSAVRALWKANMSPQIAACTRVYVEASALGVLGDEPYATAVRTFNEEWLVGLATYLERSGVPAKHSRRLAALVDYVVMGMTLDHELDPAELLESSIEDLATALELLVKAG